MDEHFVNKIKELLKFNISEVCEFAPGFVMVRLLSVSGYIICFDCNRFGPTINQGLGRRIRPRKFGELELGIYYEKQIFPETSNFKEVFEWAQEHFTTINGGEKWHNAPIEIIFSN